MLALTSSPSPQHSLMSSPVPDSLLESFPSTQSLTRSQVGYHKPTSAWIRSLSASETPSEQKIAIPHSDPFYASYSTPKNPSPGFSESDDTASRATSPASDLYLKFPPGLKNHSSSSSLKASPMSLSLATALVSPSCSDIGVCNVEYEQYEEHPPIQERRLSASQKKHTKIPRTFIAPGIDLTFQELIEAHNIPLYDEEAQAVRFGDLFCDRKTIVIFIRHFLCPFCADYMRAIVREVKPSVLARSNVGLIVVSHGSPHMIKSYRGIFKLPYPIYTDPSRKIYRALNMTLRTLNGGPKSERGDYLEHNLTLGLARVAKNAIKGRMPLYRYPGDFFQVGGEFVLGPGLQCSYVSRMFNTASHAPVKEVVKAAGVDLNSPPDSHPDWERTRKEELERIRQRKGLRRGQSRVLSPQGATHDEIAVAETLKSVDAARCLLDASRQLYP